MNALRNSVIATITYHDSLDIALTPLEIYRLLINPNRWGEPFAKETQFADVMLVCADLSATGRVLECKGYIVLPGREELFERRIEREKISAQKWKKMLRLTWWFQAVPFLRGVFASGSLAFESAGEGSDFDVLIVARAGRLYTCRLLLSGLTSLMGVRRTWRDRSAPDKFCFNHYIADGIGLRIQHRSLYNAQTYARMKCIIGGDTLVKSFYDENEWMGEYLIQLAGDASGPSDTLRRSVRENKVLRMVARAGEMILSGPWGNWIEHAARVYQHKRIERNPATYESGGRVVWNDRELEFHPRSAEKRVLESYNRAIADSGLFWRYTEEDSGLA